MTEEEDLPKFREEFKDTKTLQKMNLSDFELGSKFRIAFYDEVEDDAIIETSRMTGSVQRNDRWGVILSTGFKELEIHRLPFEEKVEEGDPKREISDVTYGDERWAWCRTSAWSDKEYVFRKVITNDERKLALEDKPTVIVVTPMEEERKKRARVE